jgi:hypothetical protein
VAGSKVTAAGSWKRTVNVAGWVSWVRCQLAVWIQQR